MGEPDKVGIWRTRQEVSLATHCRCNAAAVLRDQLGVRSNPYLRRDGPRHGPRNEAAFVEHKKEKSSL